MPALRSTGPVGPAIISFVTGVAPAGRAPCAILHAPSAGPPDPARSCPIVPDRAKKVFSVSGTSLMSPQYIIKQQPRHAQPRRPPPVQTWFVPPNPKETFPPQPCAQPAIIHPLSHASRIAPIRGESG